MTFFLKKKNILKTAKNYWFQIGANSQKNFFLLQLFFIMNVANLTVFFAVRYLHRQFEILKPIFQQAAEPVTLVSPRCTTTSAAGKTTTRSWLSEPRMSCLRTWECAEHLLRTTKRWKTSWKHWRDFSAVFRTSELIWRHRQRIRRRENRVGFFYRYLEKIVIFQYWKKRKNRKISEIKIFFTILKNWEKFFL